MGTDICQISRMKLSLSKRILTKDELAIYDGITLEQSKLEFLAGRFSAKEAIYKALSDRYPKLGMRDVTILNDAYGRPQVIQPTFDDLRVLVSISHEKEYAIALAIVEER